MNTWFQKLPADWQELLDPYLSPKERSKITDSLQGPIRAEKSYPEPKEVFRAFECTRVKQVKVVLLGQDPYHGPGQAHGLAFSVPSNQALPPSLQNVFKELQADLGLAPEKSGDLSGWAEQGVFLLNSFLTVGHKAAGSHRTMGWQALSDAAITGLSAQRKNLVFLLWGKFAQGKSALIDEEKHLILSAPHPSPLAAHRGFFGSRPFSKTNQYLVQHGVEPIKW